MSNGISAAKYFGDEEDTLTGACYDAAIRAGKTQDEADNCDDGSCHCPTCPFIRNEEAPHD